MDMDVSTALTACADMKLVHQRLQILQNLGLGFCLAGLAFEKLREMLLCNIWLNWQVP